MSKPKVIYKERKKKPALPNRKSKAQTSPEELAMRQDTAQRAAIVYRQMLPGLLVKLNRIEDPRNPKKVKHKMTVLMAHGILLYVFQIGSRREANRTMSNPIFFENLNSIFPELKTLPHADTLARLLE
ncbi:transposase family protein [Desulfotruncus alcoholivorax]|uniref:transposase family protein n=1 Tax=Desulfotruncus alcoholivorax TaxID=265477 RepID=UPI0005575120|nr:transposase family protein [Desulfotruncus alcoholivorax]